MASGVFDLDKVSVRKLELSDDFSCFDCSLDDDLDCDGFIHREEEAKLFQRERQGITYLFVHEGVLVGYVTLAMSSIPAKRVDRRLGERVRLRFYPSLLVGRLGVDSRWRGRGVGTFLCSWCVGFAMSLSKDVGCRYVILETVSGEKVRFYEKCGFQKAKEVEEEQTKLIWLYQRIALE